MLKLPQKPTPVKANAVNTGDTQPKGKSKGGKGRSESAPPPGVRILTTPVRLSMVLRTTIESQLTG